jgi:hypothetical protein
MSKPGGDPSSGISSEDVLIPTERHPACRQREARSGSGTERENLDGDAKGKGTSGSNREADSTDAPGRGGLLRSSDEGEGSGPSPLARVNRQREEPDVQWKAAAFARWHEPDDADTDDRQTVAFTSDGMESLREMLPEYKRNRSSPRS